MPQPISNRCRQIIANCIRYCDEEKLKKDSTIPIHKINERAAAMTGKSLKTIKRIRKEGNSSEVASTSNSDYNSVEKKLRHITNKDVCAIRHTIRHFYTVCKETPTLQLLLPVLVAEGLFEGNKPKLKQVLHKIGFYYRKNPRKGRLLLEKSAILLVRMNYLNTVRENQRLEKTKPTIYIYEGSLITKSIIQSEDDKMHETSWRILLAADIKGLLKNGICIYKNKIHNKAATIIAWLKNNIVLNITVPHLFCVESVIQAKTELNKKPGFFDSKEQMYNWLTANNIDHSTEMYRSELLYLIEKSQVQPRYEINEYLESLSQQVAAIPAKHPDLNPLASVWTNVKSKLNLDDTGLTNYNLEMIISNMINEYEADYWLDSFKNTILVCDKYYEDEMLIDDYTD